MKIMFDIDKYERNLRRDLVRRNGLRMKLEDSESINFIAYNKGLLIKFQPTKRERRGLLRRDGTKYERYAYYYPDVPEEVVNEMLECDSFGRFYNLNIKNEYTCIKVDRHFIYNGRRL